MGVGLLEFLWAVMVSPQSSITFPLVVSHRKIVCLELHLFNIGLQGQHRPVGPASCEMMRQ